MSPPPPAKLIHTTADLVGVPAEQLADGSLVSGLVVAAASAAGLGATEVPLVRERPRGGISAMLLLDDCHIVTHAIPERRLLVVDVLAPTARAGRRAIEVFSRRLRADDVRTETRERGEC